jgi:hypothetical protein
MTTLSWHRLRNPTSAVSLANIVVDTDIQNFVYYTSEAMAPCDDALIHSIDSKRDTS